MSYKQNVASAVLGLVLTLLGLVLAILSNPARFSLDVADDRYIRLFAISGFVCTLAGVFYVSFLSKKHDPIDEPSTSKKCKPWCWMGVYPPISRVLPA